MALDPPVAVGLTICRDVVREPTSGNVSVIRSFTGMPVAAFPGAGEPFCALAVLTDAEGDVPFRLVISRGERFEPVRTLAGTVHFPDRLQLVELVVRFPAFAFPAPDTYMFALYFGEDMVAHRSLRIYRREEQS